MEHSGIRFQITRVNKLNKDDKLTQYIRHETDNNALAITAKLKGEYIGICIITAPEFSPILSATLYINGEAGLFKMMYTTRCFIKSLKNIVDSDFSTFTEFILHIDDSCNIGDLVEFNIKNACIIENLTSNKYGVYYYERSI